MVCVFVCRFRFVCFGYDLLLLILAFCCLRLEGWRLHLCVLWFAAWVVCLLGFDLFWYVFVGVLACLGLRVFLFGFDLFVMLLLLIGGVFGSVVCLLLFCLWMVVVALFVFELLVCVDMVVLVCFGMRGFVDLC